MDDVIVHILLNRKEKPGQSFPIVPTRFVSSHEHLIDHITPETATELSKLAGFLSNKGKEFGSSLNLYETNLQEKILPFIKDRELLSILKSDEFQRSFQRYTLLRNSDRIWYSGVKFQGRPQYEACIRAKQNIAKDTLIWELCGVLSSDPAGESYSTIIPHPSQFPTEKERARWMVGPARLCNHSCRPNAILRAIPAQPAFIVQVTRPLLIGDEITISYGKDFWAGNCLCARCRPETLIYLETV